jgi:hypothetical protein
MAALLLVLGMGAAAAAEEAPRNLALSARASAFESYQSMTPELAVDGKMETRWSGIPGDETNGWFQLDWDQPVRVSEAVVFQHDRYVREMDLQAWDDAAANWRTIEHLGQANGRLPKVVVSQFGAMSTRRLRLANILGGPSFTEIMVFERAFARPPVLTLASDCDGHFIGIVCDEWGSAPARDAEVVVSGQAEGGAWSESARTDGHGLLTIPMPVGMTGQISATIRPGGSDAAPVAPVRFGAAQFQYGLTPANFYRRATDLSGLWRFAPDPPNGFWEPAFDDSHWANIHVPAHFEMEGFQSVEGVGGYRRRFALPPGPGRVKVRFDGVYSGAEVWVNGHRLAYHEGGALPFEVDVTGAVHEGENLLAVRVTQHTAVSDKLDKMSEYADFALAGLMRPVSVFRVPEAHLGALAFATVFDAGFRDAKIQGHVAVLNESGAGLGDAIIVFRLLDPEGREVPLQFEPVPAQVRAFKRADLEFTLPVATPRHWDAEHPNLYTLELTLKAGDMALDRLAQHVGFRQTEIRDRQLLINGRPVKIRGTCHHDSHPLLGRAVTLEVERQDLELMKEANLNSVRTSHYPPLPALLDLADELGIWVEDEGSFCWVEVADDLRLAPRMMQLNAELLARDRNHPSVFIWSVGNESSWGFGFDRVHEWMGRSDPSRPHAGSWSHGVVNIEVWHNPICLPDIDRAERSSKPVIWDESWCIFQGIWGDIGEMWLDPGIRDYYAEPLPPVYARMMQSKNIMGSQIWAWSDDIFCVPNRGLEYGREATLSHFIEGEYRLPNRGLVGDAPWGVVDGWRRKKPEFWVTRKLHSPVKIKEAPLSAPGAGQTLAVAVENQYDFTDLSELGIRWRLGDEEGTIRLNAPPHTTGELQIKPSREVRTGEELQLEFVDAAGRRVDAYRLPVGAGPVRVPTMQTPAPASLRLIEENLLAGRGTRVVGSNFELTFDQATGRLRRGVGYGQALLLSTPELHLLPSATPFSPLPNLLSWHLKDLRVKSEGENVRIEIDGSYDRFEGGYDVLVAPAGEVTARASFKYSGEKVVVREVGLGFVVPRDCDVLHWNRQGEWSVYPPDHIGRLDGETRAFASHADQLPPTWPWSEDNSPMGCNDFRSAKRHIHWASIRYPEGMGVWVKSDGSQHLRATVESDRISVCINDWYGGSHTGLREWNMNYGDGKPIATGEQLTSTVRLQFGRTLAH